MLLGVPFVTTATVALLVFVIVRGPAWATVSTLPYPLGAIGAERAGIGYGTVVGVLNVAWGGSNALGPVLAGRAGRRRRHPARARPRDLHLCSRPPCGCSARRRSVPRGRRLSVPFPHLFTPLALGPIELASRIVSTSHQTSLVHDHLPTDELVAYHAERARGGVGLILIEATAVHPSGLLTPHTLGGYLPEIVDGYRRLAAAVPPARQRGSACSSSTAVASRSRARRARRRSRPPPCRAGDSAIEPRATTGGGGGRARRGLRPRGASLRPKAAWTRSR